MTRFKTKEELQRFLDVSFTCVCGKLLTGLHELTCPKIQVLKVKLFGNQDNHPIVNIPKVVN